MRKKAKFTVRRFDAAQDYLCRYNQQSSESHGQVVDPYGGLGRRAAKGAWGQFAQPLLGYFGGGAPNFRNPEGRRAQNYAEMMANFENTPLGQFAGQYKDFFPGMLEQAQGVGQRVASEAPGIYEAMRAQIQNALGQMPGLQQTAAGNLGAAQQGLGMAGRAVNESFSPIANQALYQNALQEMLGGARQGAAGRGLLDAGSAQAQEEVLGRDLASQFAMNQAQQQQAALMGQQNALGGVQNALGMQAGLLPMGAQLAGMQGGALDQLAQQLQQGYGIPAEALQQVFAQLASFANPTMAVGQMAAPTVTTSGRSSGFGIL